MSKNYSIIGRKLNGIICKGSACQTDSFSRVYDSMWNLLMSIEEEEGKFIAVSSIVEDLKPYIGRITVYGDRCIPKMAGFNHTFRGMTRNIDFYDNAEFTAS